MITVLITILCMLGFIFGCGAAQQAEENKSYFPLTLILSQILWLTAVIIK